MSPSTSACLAARFEPARAAGAAQFLDTLPGRHPDPAVAARPAARHHSARRRSQRVGGLGPGAPDHRVASEDLTSPSTCCRTCCCGPPSAASASTPTRPDLAEPGRARGHPRRFPVRRRAYATCSGTASCATCPRAPPRRWRRLTTTNLPAFRGSQTIGGNIIVAIAGDVRRGDVVPLVPQALAGLPPGSASAARRYPQAQPPRSSSARVGSEQTEPGDQHPHARGDEPGARRAGRALCRPRRGRAAAVRGDPRQARAGLRHRHELPPDAGRRGAACHGGNGAPPAPPRSWTCCGAELAACATSRRPTTRWPTSIAYVVDGQIVNLETNSARARDLTRREALYGVAPPRASVSAPDRGGAAGRRTSRRPALPRARAADHRGAATGIGPGPIGHGAGEEQMTLQAQATVAGRRGRPPRRAAGRARGRARGARGDRRAGAARGEGRRRRGCRPGGGRRVSHHATQRHARGDPRAPERPGGRPERFVRGGSRNEDPSTVGAAHFMEHMFFQGTPWRPSSRLIDAPITERGGWLNATTAWEGITFFAAVPNDAFDVMLDVIVGHPGELDLPAGRPGQGAARGHRGAKPPAQRSLRDTRWRPTRRRCSPTIRPTRCPRATASTVRTVSRDTLTQFRERFFIAPNLVVAAVGNLRHEDVERQIAAAFADMPTGPAPQWTRVPPPPGDSAPSDCPSGRGKRRSCSAGPPRLRRSRALRPGSADAVIGPSGQRLAGELRDRLRF